MPPRKGGADRDTAGAPEQVEKVTVAEHLGQAHPGDAFRCGTGCRQPRLHTTFGGDVSPALSRATAGTTIKVIEGGKASDWSFKSRRCTWTVTSQFLCSRSEVVPALHRIVAFVNDEVQCSGVAHRD